MSPDPRAATVAATLAAATAGALVFRLVGLPLPFLLGAVAATTLAGLAGMPVVVPRGLRTLVMGLLGIFIGAAFDPARLEGLGRWGVSLALLVVAAALSAAVGYLWLRRVGRLRGRDAFFAAMPGGLSEMVLLADRLGGDVGRVALIHGVRVWAIVTAAPFVIRALGGAAPIRPLWNGIAPTDMGVLLLAGLAGALLARRLRLPAWALTGPLVASALIHLSGLVAARPPTLLVAAAQVVIGAAIASRLQGLGRRDAGRLLLAALGLTALMFAVTALLAFGVHLATGLSFAALLIAYVPGGVVEMGLIALALGIDPAFVATHHVLRILVLVTSAPTLHALWRHYRRRRD